MEKNLKLGSEKIKILEEVNSQGYNMVLKDVHNIHQKLKVQNKSNDFADARKILNDNGNWMNVKIFFILTSI